MNNIKAILFDVDGVLIQGKMFSQHYLADFGVQIPDSFFETEFEDAVLGKKDLKEIVQPKLKEWKWEKSAADLIEYWLQDAAKADVELLATVEQLKKQGIKCYVVTNQEKYRAKHLVEKLGFGTLFDGFFASSLIGYKKPQLAFFDHVLKTIDCKGEEVVYFDDSPGYLTNAKALGIHAYFFENNKQFKDVLKDFKLL
jgi:putative hydrolase of the HAD superfamily